MCCPRRETLSKQQNDQPLTGLLVGPDPVTVVSSIAGVVFLAALLISRASFSNSINTRASAMFTVKQFLQSDRYFLIG